MLALWNNTEHNVGFEMTPAADSVAATTEAYQWRPNGKTVDMSTAYSWNVTISADLTGSVNLDRQSYPRRLYTWHKHNILPDSLASLPIRTPFGL